MEQITNLILKKKEIIDCSLKELWWKWTTHEGLLTFFGKDNRVELKLDGHYEIYFLLDNPEGLRGGEGNRIISYVPQEMLSFTWNAPPHFPFVRNHHHKTWVVVSYKSLQENRCEISIQHLGWLEGEEWAAVYSYFDSAWDTVLDCLKASCQKIANN